MSRSSKWITPERRAAIYLRDDFRCVYCQRKPERSRWRHPWTDPAISVGLTLDHVVPEHEGGDNGSGNVVTCCERCNDAKGRMSLEEWLGRVRGCVSEGSSRSIVSLVSSLEGAEERVRVACGGAVDLVAGKRLIGVRAARPLAEFRGRRRSNGSDEPPF